MSEILCSGNSNKENSVFRDAIKELHQPHLFRVRHGPSHRETGPFIPRKTDTWGYMHNPSFMLTPGSRALGAGREGRRGIVLLSASFTIIAEETSPNLNPFPCTSYLFNHFPSKCERINPQTFTLQRLIFPHVQWKSDLSSVSSGQTQNKSRSMIQQAISSSKIICV